MASSKKQKRGAKASRSSFRPTAKAKKPKPKPTKTRPKPKPKAAAKKQNGGEQIPRRSPGPARDLVAAGSERALETVSGSAPVSDGSPTVRLGGITVPSGTLAIFDIGLVGYLPREALEPAIVKARVPRDRELAVVGARSTSGRFTDRWDHVAVVLAPGEVHSSKKLGEAGVDFARLVCMDLEALDHWVHEDSLDGRADFVFWGRDAPHLARSMNAKRLAEGYGWIDLPVEQAEAKADEAARRKAANKWLLATDTRPHSHHFHALAAARSSSYGAGTLELAGTQLLLFFTSWGDGVFPIYLDRDADEQPLRIRVQLAMLESSAAMAAINP